MGELLTFSKKAYHHRVSHAKLYTRANFQVVVIVIHENGQFGPFLGSFVRPKMGQM